jgi:carboxyl-terminal processing protease
MVLGGTVFGQSPQDRTFEILKNLDIYSSLIKQLNNDYVDEINPGELTKTGIDAMLESLDPYTNFIPESEVEDYRFITTGQYGGIGALIHQQGDYVVISEPYEGSPAQKSGLLAGDKILEVNGQNAVGKNYDQVSTILKGQSGTTVMLKIKRDGMDKPIEKSINRENIKIDNIPYSGILSEDIGYIRLTGFTQNAARDFRQAFQKLREAHDLSGVIIDLRGNGGGLLTEAVDISANFVEKGQEIVRMKGKVSEKNRIYQTTLTPVDQNIPIVVLVDRSSASASEILAGAMQDLDRGVIMGQRTFGKGLVQNVIPLSYNAQLKITVAKYYIPSGRCIQAIDYSHKNNNGGFSRIPDSLIREFKTKTGRSVYDGGGISPDIMTNRKTYSNIAMALFRKYLIFDYATKYHQLHPSIAPAGEFRIDDATYQDFLAYIQDKDYEYTTESEKALNELETLAQKEHYYEAIREELAHLHNRMADDKKEDIRKHEDQIRDLLRTEIITRYYYQKGKAEAAIKNDTEIGEAISMLRNKERYNDILAGRYVQPADQRILEEEDVEEPVEMIIEEE